MGNTDRLSIFPRGAGEYGKAFRIPERGWGIRKGFPYSQEAPGNPRRLQMATEGPRMVPEGRRMVPGRHQEDPKIAHVQIQVQIQAQIQVKIWVQI